MHKAITEGTMQYPYNPLKPFDYADFRAWNLYECFLIFSLPLYGVANYERPRTFKKNKGKNAVESRESGGKS